MKQPQVINLIDDSVLAFDGASVIRNSDQKEISEVPFVLVQVDVNLWDLMTNANVSVSNIPMTYHSIVDFWTIDVDDIVSILVDRHKFVGQVTENGAVVGMRAFKIHEFAVDNDGLEDTLMRLPFEIQISGSSQFVWYNVGQVGVGGQERYKAPAYEGGTGTIVASDPSRVTHRGAVVVF